MKRFTHSDLTFFKRYYDTSTGAKQKGINLNINIFIDIFYPNFPESGTRVELLIQGPGFSTPPHLLLGQKLGKFDKNWRLNGKIVQDPVAGDVDRYAALQPGDLALLEFFDGSDGMPTRVNLVVISQDLEADAAPFSALNARLGPGKKKMVALTPAALADLVAGSLPAAHPIEAFLPADDFALGLLAEGVAVDLSPEDAPEPTPDPSAPSARPRRRRAPMPFDYNKVITPSTKRVTAEAFDKVKKAQAVNGQAGEKLVNDYFAAHPELGTFEWSSKAISTTSLYDFRRTDIDDGDYIDVKTTSESFDAAFNMSIYELRQAAQSPGPYRIYRVYDVGNQPRMRISEDISAFARTIMAQCDTTFKPGLTPGVFSILPELFADELNFGGEIILPVGEDVDED